MEDLTTKRGLKKKQGHCLLISILVIPVSTMLKLEGLKRFTEYYYGVKKRERLVLGKNPYPIIKRLLCQRIKNLSKLLL